MVRLQFQQIRGAKLFVCPPWTVGEADNGTEVLDRVSHAPPYLIALDLIMSVLDGFLFLRLCFLAPDGADIPAVVLGAKKIVKTERGCPDGADRIFESDHQTRQRGR